MPMHEDHYDGGDGWVAGIDFDPHDPEEMEVMHLVWEKEKYDKIERLERENAQLREALSLQSQLRNSLTDCAQCGKQAVCVNLSGDYYCGGCANEIVESFDV